MKQLKFMLFGAFLLPLALLTGAAPVIPVWDLGKEEPVFYTALFDVRNQKASYEVMPDGKTALKIDLSQSTSGSWSGNFRSYRIFPDFTEAVVKVRYYVPENCTVQRSTLVLCDRNNEQFPLDFKIEKVPGWHEAAFTLDSRQKQTTPWKTSIRAGQGKKYDSGGVVNFFDQPMRIIGINGRMVNREKAPGSWIAFGPITLEVKTSLGAIRPRLETGRVPNVLQKGDEKELCLAFFNPEETPYRGRVEVTVSDAYGKVVEKQQSKVEAAAGQTVRVPLTVPKKFGVYTLKTVSRADGKTPLELKQSFAYMDPTGATPDVRSDGFLFGVVTHYRKWRFDSETEAPMMALCGVKMMREDTAWGAAQPDPKLPLSFAFWDDALEPYTQLGIEFQPILDFPPKWAIDTTVKRVFPERQEWGKCCPKPDLWRTYCHDFFTRYKGKFRFYEVWNEADITFANFGWEDYIKLQRIAFEELRKVDPAAKLLTTGYARPPKFGLTDRDHVQKTMRDTASYDVLACHGHVLYPQYRNYVKNFTDHLQKLTPGKPWYANETAMTSTITGEFGQGVQLFKKLLHAWAKGSIGYTWYDFRNDGYDLSYTEHNFGMMTRDFYPKPVYGVFNTLTKHLSDAKFVKEMIDEPALEGYWFRAKAGDLYFGFWGWRKGEISYALKNVTGKASLIDLFGNETPLTVEAGCVILPVNAEGQFLRLQGAKDVPQPSGSVVVPETLPLVAESGAVVSTHLFITNPLPVKAQWGWRITSPAALSVTPANFAVTLAPGEKKTLPLKLAAPQNTPSERLSGALILNQTLNGKPLLGLRLPVVAMTNAVPSGAFPAKPQFVLDKAEHLAQIDPAPESLWFGPKDGSAEIRIARKGNHLLIRIDVTDNVFHQPYTGQTCFNGDNVQLFFALPERQGQWSFGISKTKNGVEKWCYASPDKLKRFTDFKAAVTPLENGGMRYELALPFSKLGLTEKSGRNGFHFNCFINDNDGKGRKDYLGICTEQNPARYPMVFLR